MADAALTVRQPRLGHRSRPGGVADSRTAPRPSVVAALTLLALVLWLVVVPLQVMTYLT